MSREEIEERVRSKIQREISHETWRGLHIGSYRYKVPVPPELQGSEWTWGYCSHWSTHEGAEPLVSLFDAAQTIDALLAENERLREALKEIDAMPHYVAPIPENHLSSLHKRYERVLSIAEAALKDPDQ